ncbi:peptidyl-prolyl cis-trans isomerase [Thalassovita taeanensis]|uniref:Parvulin-like PPIase n=1 Tax=Thalassovita taeanensis TaxID=657014 RepID=A0A1H8YW58_9RHOB|nr:peptidyl-prolyl cis-trans isomerase [Thalassovita taeanensis]SEP56356.1 peptidyl-prolyl cis-trans isomerase D [Thalassovita taeanensis]
MASGATKTLVWGLMGLLVLGLGGFGVTNLSGNVRTIGSVGDQEIDINDYARALQEDIRAIEAQTGQSITFEQAQSFGLDKNVLGRLIGQAALDNEAATLGLSIGDENLRRQIVAIDAFQGPAGDFDREAYKFTLSQAGLTESKFEAQIRADTTRAILQGAVIKGAPVPAAFVDTLVAYAAERRGFVWAQITPDDLTTPLPAPTEDQLAAYYAANEPAFTTPAKKRLTYAWLSPDMLLDTVEVDEADIQAQYDARSAEFNQPERRLVERLSFPDMTTAETAKAAIEREETDFEATVAERGLSLSDIDMGDVSRADLGPEASAVFNADVGDIVGPFETTLGPALFRVNGVLPEQATAYDDVRDDLRDELATDRARRQIETTAETVDDLLAGGATLEELHAEAGMTVAQIDWFDGAPEDIAAYTGFRDAALAVQPGDYPQVIHLDDGGIVSLRLDEELPPQLQSLDTVRDDAIAGWTAAETTKALAEQATALLTRLTAGEDMAALGLTAQIETDVTRNQFMPGTPNGFLSQVFGMTPGDVTVISGDEAVVIVRLDDILPPDMTNPEVETLTASLTDQTEAGIAQDIYAAYARDIQNRAGISLDQAALNAVHANFR